MGQTAVLFVAGPSPSDPTPCEEGGRFLPHGQNLLKAPLTSLLKRKTSCQVSIELPSKWGGQSPSKTIVSKCRESSLPALEFVCSLTLWSRARSAENTEFISSGPAPPGWS